MAAFVDEDMNVLHINTFVFNASINNVENPAVIPNFFNWKWKMCVMYWWFLIFMFWNSVLVITARTGFLDLVEFEDSSQSPCFQESEFWAFSCRLTWERSTSGFWVVRTSLLVLVWSPCPSSTFAGLTGYPKSCGGFSLALHGLRSTKLTGLAFPGTIGFGSAIGEPTLKVASWPLFDMALCFPIGSQRNLLKWLQDNIEKFKMLSKWRRWFHSSRVKLPLVSMSASWFLGSTYLIWIFGSKVILSNNQSSTTQWVLDMCLIVGLPPLITILITASLSSKMYNWDSPWEECVLVGTWSTFDNYSTSHFLFSVGVLVCFLSMEWSLVPHKSLWASLPCLAVLFVERNTSITMSQRLRAGGPSMRNPASKK